MLSCRQRHRHRSNTPLLLRLLLLLLRRRIKGREGTGIDEGEIIAVVLEVEVGEVDIQVVDIPTTHIHTLKQSHTSGAVMASTLGVEPLRGVAAIDSTVAPCLPGAETTVFSITYNAPLEQFLFMVRFEPQLSRTPAPSRLGFSTMYLLRSVPLVAKLQRQVATPLHV